MLGQHAADHGLAAAGGHVHVDEHDIGEPFADHLDRGVDLRRLADHVGVRAQLGRTPLRNRWWSSTRNTRGRGRVGHAGCRFIVSSTSVPWPGAERIDRACRRCGACAR